MIVNSCEFVISISFFWIFPDSKALQEGGGRKSGVEGWERGRQNADAQAYLVSVLYTDYANGNLSQIDVTLLEYILWAEDTFKDAVFTGMT